MANFSWDSVRSDLDNLIGNDAIVSEIVGQDIDSVYDDRPDDPYLTALLGPSVTDSESFSDPDNYASDVLNAANDAALQQQESAQNSADRAMEWQEQFNEQYQKFQREMADLAWNREMDAANTSYQRMMADLKAAGLNPKLVGKLGGAATPSYDISSTYSASGQSASMQMASLSALGSVLSSYITGADALDRNQNDFVQRTLSSLISILPFLA